MLRKLILVLILVGVLSGCSGELEFEKVMDVHLVPETRPASAIALSIPEEAVLAVFGDEKRGKLYLCDGFDLSVQTLEGGDLSRTLRQITGFSEDQLTVMKTAHGGLGKYECVWASVGEGAQQVGKALILDDGMWHYAVSVMANASDSEALQERWRDLFRSVSLVSTDS